ncbi:Uma2 family endonuclease [Nocardioides insulae]|uniref:Uma2 family endonuclease n=1 Tax=Nocardioides insulae TaxID=394734 RepID=UPI00048DD627|nr:Uma2 family endonuclease [Nocardioides insulae]
MSVMTTWQVPGRWREADLASLPDDGHRYEIVDGVLLVNAAPAPRHQRVVHLLWRLPDSRCPHGWWVLASPLDVVLAEDTVVEPDLLVAPKAAFGPKNLRTPPLLVVEVLSPSTRRVDLELKRARYERAGIASYWIVDPDTLHLTVLELRDGAYAEVADVAAREAWTAAHPFEVTVTPGDLLD